MSAPFDVTGPETIRGLQERAARALPAEFVEEADGWWLRYAPRGSWWVGSVLPHGDTPSDWLMRRVAGAERFYAGRGSVTRFQISPGACPEGLDSLLAERGYRRESPMSLQAASTAQVLDRLPAGPLQAEVTDHPTGAWFSVWHAVHGHGGDPRAAWDMLQRVERPCGYATVSAGDGVVVAVGRAVAEAGWAGLFGVAVLPQVRGRGAARSVLAALAEWAAARQADRMYLQVEPGNSAALRLYGRAGFGEVGGYHYRTAAV